MRGSQPPFHSRLSRSWALRYAYDEAKCRFIFYFLFFSINFEYKKDPRIIFYDFGQSQVQ